MGEDDLLQKRINSSEELTAWRWRPMREVAEEAWKPRRASYLEAVDHFQDHLAG